MYSCSECPASKPEYATKNIENFATIPSGSVLTKEQTDMIFEFAEKPIKVIFEDVTELKMDGYNIEIKGKLSGIQAEKIIGNIFGTTDIAALDCSDMSEEEIDRIVDNFNSIPEVYPIRTEDLKKILERSNNA